jgi:hypothetical protein
MISRNILVCICAGIMYWFLTNVVYYLLQFSNTQLIEGTIVLAVLPFFIGFTSSKFIDNFDSIKRVLLFSLLILFVREFASTLKILILHFHDIDMLDYFKRSMLGFLRLGSIQFLVLSMGSWIAAKKKRVRVGSKPVPRKN